MSTRITIAMDKFFHVYRDCNEYGFIFVSDNDGNEMKIPDAKWRSTPPPRSDATGMSKREIPDHAWDIARRMTAEFGFCPVHVSESGIYVIPIQDVCKLAQDANDKVIAKIERLRRENYE